MKSNSSNNETPPPSRRQFLHGGMMGAWLAGLGGLTGWLTPGGTLPRAGAAGRTLSKEFDYDVSRFQKTDPALVKYQLTGNVPTGMKEPRRLAVSADNQLWVAGDRAVHRFDRDGRQVQVISTGDSPRCLAIGFDSTVYVGEKGQVAVYGKSGDKQASWPVPASRSVLTAIAAGEKDVFVADAGSRLVWHYDLAGRLIKSIGKKNPDKDVPGFIVPSPYFDLAIGADGLLWVANPGQHRLEAYTFAGDFETSWGETALSVEGFSGCCNPVSFAILPDGRFVTCEKGLTRVKVYSAHGKFESVVAGPESFPQHALKPNTVPVGMDVAVDSAGRVMVADPLIREIRLFSPMNKAAATQASQA